MSNEHNYFITIIADHLNGRETNLPNFEVDWEKLTRISKYHEMSGALYYQCKTFMASEYVEELSRNVSSELFFYVNRIEMEQRIAATFEKEKAPCFLVKGTRVAEYYPVPALRSMGDSDIVIHEEDVPKIHPILQNMGFTCKYKSSSYYMNDMLFEFHSHLVSGNEADSRVSEYFDDCWRHVQQGKLDWNFHFLFLMHHFQRHFFHSGVGFATLRT